MNEDVKDRLVTQTYRESAVERAPDTLNQAILKHAGEQAGQADANRYAKSVFWLRPMAWAASVGLCLAIVVNLNEELPAELSIEPPPAARPAPQRTAPERKEAELLEKSERANSEPADKNIATPALPAAEVLADRVGRADMDDTAEMDDMAEMAGAAAAKAAPIEQAETLLRMREGDNKSPDIQSFAASAAPGLAAAIEPACQAEQRQQPETWLTCIEGLETDGLDELARHEREALMESFPDFEFP